MLKREHNRYCKSLSPNAPNVPNANPRFYLTKQLHRQGLQLTRVDNAGVTSPGIVQGSRGREEYVLTALVGRSGTPLKPAEVMRRVQLARAMETDGRVGSGALKREGLGGLELVRRIIAEPKGREKRQLVGVERPVEGAGCRNSNGDRTGQMEARGDEGNQHEDEDEDEKDIENKVQGADKRVL